MIMNKCPFKTFTIGSLTAVIVLHLFEKHYMKSRLLLKSTFHIYWRCLLIRFFWYCVVTLPEFPIYLQGVP
jgi:hypothetical protein